MVTFIILVVGISIAAIQIIYLAVLLMGFSRDRREPSQPGKAGVSVIVCAHDEESNLRELVPLLLSQAYHNFEVIIVDDRSNDGTFDYLLQETSNNPKLRMVTVRDAPRHMTGKKFALTMGIKAAKNDWILLTDADCRPNAGWVAGMASYCQEPAQIVIGFSPYTRRDGLLNSFIRFEALVTAVQYIGFALLGRPYMGVGRNLAYRRQLFLESKGFIAHQEIIGGDDDLFVNQHATRQNVAVALGTSVVVPSAPKATWAEYFFQKFRHLSVGKRYKWGDRVLLGFFTLSWIGSVLAWAAVPWAGPWLLGALALRSALLVSVVTAAERRLKEPFEGWKVPFLDFIYAFYYLVAGPIALLTKRVRWKI